MRRSRSTVVVILAALICSTLGTALAAVAQKQAAGGPAPAAAPQPRGVAQLAEAPVGAAGRLLGIATFGGARPTATRLAALEKLGLVAQPFKNLPLALVFGTKDQLESAVKQRAAADVYPNAKLKLYSEESVATIKAGPARNLGVTGKGVGVAVLDTGVDATHPDLADHVTHNVKLIGPEYLDLVGINVSPGTPPGTLVVPVDQLPYNNSDTSGHGTHVAGIIAADQHTSPSQVGVAPDASIISYGAGDALFIFTVLAAFDDMLTHQKDWGIQVVNNSWGDVPRLYDALHPINQATKALHDAGIVSVFSAGNDSERATINPYSVAPWVISVGSTTMSGERSDFSAAGLEYDNSEPVPLPADRHLRFTGDRIGIYHPDVSAPGTDITSSGTPTGIGIQAPALPGGTATISGTSMSAPHVSGLVALLLEARPRLTPDQVRQVLQVTAGPVKGDAPFWQSGYGLVDATAALALVRRADFSQRVLDELQDKADQRVQAAREFRPLVSDLWAYTAGPATVGGLETRSFQFPVAEATKAISASVTYPSTNLLGENLFDYQLTITDARGRPLATSTASAVAGVSSLFVDLTKLEPAVSYGTWTATVAGQLGVTDPDIQLGNVVSLAVAQLEPMAKADAPAGPSFKATGALPLYLSPAGPAGLLPSPEGCEGQDNPARGELTASPSGAACRSALVGFAITHLLGQPAEFTSAPSAGPVTVGGPAELTLHLADAAAPVYSAALASVIDYELVAIDGDGKVQALSSGTVDEDAVADLTPAKGQYRFEVPPAVVPAGSRLQLKLRFSGVYASGLRLLYGKGFADSALKLTTGTFE